VTNRPDTAAGLGLKRRAAVYRSGVPLSIRSGVLRSTGAVCCGLPERCAAVYPKWRATVYRGGVLLFPGPVQPRVSACGGECRRMCAIWIDTVPASADCGI